MRSSIIAVCTLCLCGLPAAALAQASPLTLEAALTASRSFTGSATAAEIVDDASRAVSRASPSPALSVDTGFSTMPQGGQPAQSSLSEQLSIEFGSANSRLGALRTSQGQVAQAAASLASTHRTNIQTTITAFFSVASDQAQLAAAKDAASLARRTLDAAAQRRKVGVAPLVDQQRARGAFEAAQADQAAASSALSGDRAALAALIGSADFTNVTLPNPASVPDERQIIQATLESSPAVAASRAAVVLAQAKELVAHAQASPGLSLGTGVQVTRTGSAQSIGPVIGLSLTAPIATNLLRANLASARAATTVTQANVTQVQRDSVQAALRARQQTVSSAAKLPYLRAALADARRVAEATAGGYRLGAVSSADVIIAQTQLVNARNAFDTAVIQAALAYSTLQLEIGALK